MWAYELRNSPALLEVSEDTVDVEMPDANESAESAPPPAVERMGSQNNTTHPSECLADNVWVDVVRESFEALFLEVTDEMKEQADELHSRLLQSLGSHIQKKVDERKRSHFTLKWFRQNLSQFAAIVTLAGHVHDEPSMVGNNDCLLKNPVGSSHRFILVTASANVSNAEGCYLHYDTFNGEWVRSGKVSGTQHDSKGIMDRHKEHMVSAAQNDKSSDLYVKYPAKQSRVATMAQSNKVHRYPWKAYFEDLELFCGIGFIHSESVEQSLTFECDYSDSDSPMGVLMWDKNCIDSWNKCERDGETSLQDKQLHMVAHLLELGYDLMLSAGMNVSTIPGFEKFGLPNLCKK